MVVCTFHGTPSKMKTLQIEDDDYDSLNFLDKVLHPFCEAQRALEGDQYVSVSLIVIIVKTLYSAIHAMHTAAAADFPPQFEFELSNMVEDFISCWGDPITYAPIVVRGLWNRQIGIPKLAYWAALLDPRTKIPTLQLLTVEKERQNWSDIQSKLLKIQRSCRTPLLP